MRIANPVQFTKALKILSALASQAHGTAQESIFQRICVKWLGREGVRIISTDGHRSFAVTFANDPTMPAAYLSEGIAFITLDYAQWESYFAQYSINTIFKGQDGHVKALATGRASPQQQFGIDFGKEAEPWDVQVIENFIAMKNEEPVNLQRILINPEFMTDAFVLINSLWEIGSGAGAIPPRAHLYIPATQNTPFKLTSVWPNEAHPDIKMEVVIAPYVSP